MGWFIVFLELCLYQCVVFSSCEEILCNHDGKIALNENLDSEIAVLYQINQE